MVIFPQFSSLLAIETFQNHIIFEFLNFHFAFWGSFAMKKMLIPAEGREESIQFRSTFIVASM
jgi:hypothetical protein